MKKLPTLLKSLFWSYKFSKLDQKKDKKTIIVNAINYGDLEQWRWLVKRYGRTTIKNILLKTPASAIRPPARRLAALVFGIKKFPYAFRNIK